MIQCLFHISLPPMVRGHCGSWSEPEWGVVPGAWAVDVMLNTALGSEEYTSSGTPTHVTRVDCVGGRKPHLCNLSSEMISLEWGQGMVKPPQSLYIGGFNVREFCTYVGKKGKISKMFLRWKLDVCALHPTKSKDKGLVMFGEVVGRVSGMREGVALLLSRWLVRCAVEWKEASSRLMLVRVKIKRENFVFILAYGLGSEKSEEEIEEFWNELNEYA